MLVDCSVCGGLLPAGRGCCPHCHCKTSTWKRAVLVVAAALGLGKLGCGNSMTPVVEYGPAILHDLSLGDGKPGDGGDLR